MPARTRRHEQRAIRVLPLGYVGGRAVRERRPRRDERGGKKQCREERRQGG